MKFLSHIVAVTFISLNPLDVFAHPSRLGEMCSWLYDQTYGMNERVTLDENLRRTWVAAQPPKWRSFLDFISSQVLIHDRIRFFEAFDLAFKKFLQSVVRDEELIFIYDDEKTLFKSGQWLIGYLRTKYPQFKNTPVFAVHPNELQKVVTPKTRLIYVDDASFSGTNARGAVRRIKTFMPDSRPVEVVVPFLTTYALNRIEEVGSGTIHFVKKMQTLGEITTLHKVVIPKEFEAYRDTSLEFLDHKLPDSYSFPSFLVSGQVFSEDGSDTLIPFIKDIVPPYRQVARPKME
jgi:hypothetical protein